MKDLKISEELLSEVLGINDIVHVQTEGPCSIFISRANNPAYIINIYEFAFKCKEWALTNGYFIYSTNELSFIKSFSLETIETFSNGKDTEVEAIIKASEYVLKEDK